jgi:hypothetical protein
MEQNAKYTNYRSEMGAVSGAFTRIVRLGLTGGGSCASGGGREVGGRWRRCEFDRSS